MGAFSYGKTDEESKGGSSFIFRGLEAGGLTEEYCADEGSVEKDWLFSFDQGEVSKGKLDDPYRPIAIEEETFDLLSAKRPLERKSPADGNGSALFFHLKA